MMATGVCDGAVSLTRDLGRAVIEIGDDEADIRSEPGRLDAGDDVFTAIQWFPPAGR